MPHADRWDREERLPPAIVTAVARLGLLGAHLPREDGGFGLDAPDLGRCVEEIGRGCSSLRCVLTVHAMVGHALLRWGTVAQKRAWLPRLAAGEVLAAFALTEPSVGSDAAHVETTARESEDGWVLDGCKRWITYGQEADVFLLLAQRDGRPAAFLVDADAPGLTRVPIGGMLGTRASLLAALRLEGCRVPADRLVGPVGFGFSHVAATALDLGRYMVAWGCVGIAQAALDASLRYATERRQFGVALREHQLVQRLLADMMVDVQAARLLCAHAGRLRAEGHPAAIIETAMAKYFASTAASRCADRAVQIHGANGCGGDAPVQRYLRDARVMEIIEGSNEMQQIMIARYGCSAIATGGHAHAGSQ